MHFAYVHFQRVSLPTPPQGSTAGFQGRSGLGKGPKQELEWALGLSFSKEGESWQGPQTLWQSWLRSQGGDGGGDVLHHPVSVSSSVNWG